MRIMSTQNLQRNGQLEYAWWVKYMRSVAPLVLDKPWKAFGNFEAISQILPLTPFSSLHPKSLKLDQNLWCLSQNAQPKRGLHKCIIFHFPLRSSLGYKLSTSYEAQKTGMSEHMIEIEMKDLSKECTNDERIITGCMHGLFQKHFQLRTPK